MQTLSIAIEVADTEAEGPGRRYAIWVQGCPLRCKGCCNPELLAFRGGDQSAPADLLARILATPDVEGISLLGGEPTSQAAALAEVCEGVRAAGLTVMLYTGFFLEDLRARDDSTIDRLLAACDLAVDGPYEREAPDNTRRWIGSTNQGMRHLTDAYAVDDPRFSDGETMEIRLVNGALIINGWPWDGRGLP
ncbi:MAG: anaerobic ribonucleoside-triphosphate reductase activating protein [Bradymonadia bacterium]|jgi:anaerobic ribonucleoside-triphosphate reductase activating protein